MIQRVLLAVLGLLAAAAVGAGASGAAAAAPSAGAHQGFLLVSVDGATAVALPPGQAKRAVAAECPGVVLDIDAVRAAFPAPVEVCPGVTVTSQVPGETETPVPAP